MNFHQTGIFIVSSFCTTKTPLFSQAFSFSSSAYQNFAGPAQKWDLQIGRILVFYDNKYNLIHRKQKNRIVRLSKFLLSLNFAVDCSQSNLTEEVRISFKRYQRIMLNHLQSDVGVVFKITAWAGFETILIHWTWQNTFDVMIAFWITDYCFMALYVTTAYVKEIMRYSIFFFCETL